MVRAGFAVRSFVFLWQKVVTSNFVKPIGFKHGSMSYKPCVRHCTCYSLTVHVCCTLTRQPRPSFLVWISRAGAMHRWVEGLFSLSFGWCLRCCPSCFRGWSKLASSSTARTPFFRVYNLASTLVATVAHTRIHHMNNVLKTLVVPIAEQNATKADCTESDFAWRLASRRLVASPGALGTGDLPSSSLDFPVRPEWEKDWVPSTGVKLTSAYKQVEGKEPNFTNNAKVATANRPCCSASDSLHTIST